jgi:4-amino-4-deoxy-L-arabinose transferase-like glycosyltransferase
MYAWVRAHAAGQRARHAWIVVMWLAWGLAMLTKGPVGLLPLAALLCALAVARDTARLRTAFNPTGLACFVFVGLGWYLTVIALRPELLDYFLGYETYDRLFTAVHRRHPEWYAALTIYAPVLLLGTLPWTGVLLLRRGRIAQNAGAGATRPRDRDRALLLWWLLLPLAVFAVSHSRLPLYVLPLFVPLALLAARSVSAEPPRFDPRLLVLAAGFWFAVLVGLKAVAAYYPAPLERDARAFAARLSSLVPLQNFDEIAFVDTPMYGLRLYLEINVERVALQPAEGPFASLTTPETLCHELRERERTLYLVHNDHRHAEFERTLRACGAYKSTVIGGVGQFVAITVAEARRG